MASAYRTISFEAVCVIAGMMPICILLKEDSECYRSRTHHGDGESRMPRTQHRAESMRKWQEEWSSSPKGRWTHRLIPSIKDWVNRPHGEINFHMTQFLSGHGCFRKYLHRFGHAASPLCPVCNNAEETPEHVVFECARFETERQEMLAQVGQGVKVDNIVKSMCKEESAWNAVNQAVVTITKKLQEKWRNEQRAQQSDVTEGA